MILATGSGYRKLGLPREEELSGRGVSWCATCDGFFFREQAIAVVGGGDSAIEEATFLTRFGSKVYLIHRRDELRASKIMQERAFADPKLEIVWNAEVAEINGDDRLESRHAARHGHRRHPAAGGHRPVHRDRPRPPLRAARRPGRPRRRRLRPGPAPHDADQHPRRLRLRRPGRPHLPAGRHRRRHRLLRRARRRALRRRPRPRGLQRRRRPAHRRGRARGGADRRRLTVCRVVPGIWVATSATGQQERRVRRQRSGHNSSTDGAVAVIPWHPSPTLEAEVAMSLLARALCVAFLLTGLAGTSRGPGRPDDWRSPVRRRGAPRRHGRPQEQDPGQHLDRLPGRPVLPRRNAARGTRHRSCGEDLRGR